jgi:hypothetical protein
LWVASTVFLSNLIILSISTIWINKFALNQKHFSKQKLFSKLH